MTTSATTSFDSSSWPAIRVLSTDARVALTLRMLGGLRTDEIARAFLVPESTIAQRIVRAKRTLGEARVPFEVPRSAELPARLASVLEVIYLIFNEGYSATAGDDWMRPALCEDALRLGRMLAELAPGEPEVHGLVALMEIQASRSRARIGADGEPILLLDQDRARWDHLLIRRGLAALERADRPRRGARTVRHPGRHRRLPRPRLDGRGDRLAAHRRRSTTPLPQLTPSPVVELNRAVAVSMAFGPGAGLELVDGLTAEPALEELPPAAQRAWRPAGQAGPARRGRRRVPAGRRADPQRPRARPPARTRRRRRARRLIRRHRRAARWCLITAAAAARGAGPTAAL